MVESAAPMPTLTCLFYVLVAALAIMPVSFIWFIWHEAATRGWIWLNKETRSMYVDGVKTVVTASGVAIALLASSKSAATGSALLSDAILIFSVKVAVVCLVLCVALSLLVIFALIRSFDRAQSRYSEEQRG